ncbi:MAG TPA: hypothetical protein VGJ26_15455 [Pirellulales bacterium]|jgi:hypothetical protein
MNEADTTPLLATYYEVGVDRKRRYELRTDVIRVVETRTLRYTADQTIPLSRIDLHFIRAHVRHRFCIPILFLATIALFVWWYLRFRVGLAATDDGPLFLLVLAIVSFLVGGALFKKIEYAQFMSEARVCVLVIARSGPERANFDSFVARILEQIRIVRGES